MTRPRPPLAAVGWAVLFLTGGFGLTLAFALGITLATGGLQPGEPGPREILIQTVSGFLGYGLLTWAVGFKALGLTARDLRWSPWPQAGPGFSRGLGLGVAPAVAALGLALAVAGARFTPDEGGPMEWAARVGLTLLLLAPAALLEEVMFRGVAQVALARVVGRAPAVAALSLVFAAAHLLNPNPSALGILNIALAGGFLGAAFYAPGGIWTAWGAHLGWNATLAALDAPVSGLPFGIPWLDFEPGGPAWLTGGEFGPEGGLLATAALGVALAVACRWARKETA